MEKPISLIVCFRLCLGKHMQTIIKKKERKEKQILFNFSKRHVSNIYILVFIVFSKFGLVPSAVRRKREKDRSK